MKRRGFMAGCAAALTAITLLISAPTAVAADAELERAANTTLKLLKSTQPVTVDMIARAKGMMIFPDIVKGGLLVGGATGKGVLRVDGKTDGYYRSAAISYGLQIGIARFGYVMLLMDDAALAYVRSTDGWEVGVGPNVTVADEGFARKYSTTSKEKGIYVFFVGQEGFFAGAGVEGTKITRYAE